MEPLTQDDKKEYLTLDEAAQELGMKRSTIYPYLKDLNIEGQRFGRDRKHYISRHDLERLKALKAHPWKKGQI